MSAFRAVPAAALTVVMYAASPLMGQGLHVGESPFASAPVGFVEPSPLLPAGQQLPEAAPRAWALGPEEDDAAPAWLLALWGVAPYAEWQEAGLPLPPVPSELAALPAPRRMQEQAALKRVWLQRLIRAKEERNRVSRENLAQCALLAHKLAAPEPFAELLSRQAKGNLSPRERYLAESAIDGLFSAYGVDARELRFFVEGSDLPAEHLRELADWLPLPALFNAMPDPSTPVSPAQLGADFVAELSVRRDMVLACRSVSDRASADAAAESLLPALGSYYSSLPTLLRASRELREAVLTPYARYATPVFRAWERERTRLQEHDFYGSYRLKTLDYLLH